MKGSEGVLRVSGSRGKVFLLEDGVKNVVDRESHVAVLEFFEETGPFFVMGEYFFPAGKKAFPPVPVQGPVDVSVVFLQFAAENVCSNLEVVVDPGMPFYKRRIGLGCLYCEVCVSVPEIGRDGQDSEFPSIM
jgi:hypothetical protein